MTSLYVVRPAPLVTNMSSEDTLDIIADIWHDWESDYPPPRYPFSEEFVRQVGRIDGITSCRLVSRQLVISAKISRTRLVEHIERDIESLTLASSVFEPRRLN